MSNGILDGVMGYLIGYLIGYFNGPMFKEFFDAGACFKCLIRTTFKDSALAREYV